MVVLDTTIVAVALPSMHNSAVLAQMSLPWVMNAYLLAFGGLLLPGGRLGDILDSRKVFLGGISLFTLASLACGLAQSEAMLLTARFVQGGGGAVVSAVSLALINELFPEQRERATAIGIYGFVCGAGGGLGELAGGILTQTLGWRSVFLVNVPVGIVVLACSFLCIQQPASTGRPGRLDIAGAVSITGALMLTLHALDRAPEVGWTSASTLCPFGVAAVILLLFVTIERHTAEPLISKSLRSQQHVILANAVAALWSGSVLAWFVVTALYLQNVLGFDALRVGLAFIPAELLMAIFSIGFAARLADRFGARGPIRVGLMLSTLGLGLFSCAPLDGTYFRDLFPGMLLLGLGGGLISAPLTFAATHHVPVRESGLASGLLNTSLMMGGAVGLAIANAIASERAAGLRQSGADGIAALNGGYHAAFWTASLLSAAAIVLAGVGPHSARMSTSAPITPTPTKSVSTKPALPADHFAKAGSPAD
jgi:EmrB/QacA subfamily drug resistance transporter